MGSDGNARMRHKILYWFGQNISMSSSRSRTLALKFAVGVYFPFIVTIKGKICTPWKGIPNSFHSDSTHTHAVRITGVSDPRGGGGE